MRVRPHFNPFNVLEPSETPDWKKIFKNKNPLDLEVGCSTGKWLLQYANINPKRNIVGVEIRGKYVDLAKERIQKLELKNAYVLKANINTAIQKLFQDRKIGNVFIMFPDPWYKKKHLKRRVITPEFVETLARYMAEGSELHIASDQKDLSEEMLIILERSQFFQNKYGENSFAPENIPGIVTDIEDFNIAKGNPIYRMVFKK